LVFATLFRYPISNPAIWQETFVSAVLRAILDDNDEADGNDGQPLLGLRKLDPLPTIAIEKRFLEAAATEFWKGTKPIYPPCYMALIFKSIIGWQLGTDPEVQVATYFSNHLTNGIMKYFGENGRLDQAAKFLQPLYEKDAEVGAVLAKAYIGNGIAFIFFTLRGYN
jgi:Chs5-Arf1p-binding protein BUD7/BCH1